MEILATAAIMLIVWMLWQLYRARRFNQFKRHIIRELKPKVQKAVDTWLVAQRSELTPNTDAHIAASQAYWTAYPSRTLQAALRWHVIDQQWLIDSGNVRNCQHLFFIEQDKLAHFNDEQTSDD
ncbi:hypothetical protein [Colwellia sp. MEBiC06753]